MSDCVFGFLKAVLFYGAKGALIVKPSDLADVIRWGIYLQFDYLVLDKDFENYPLVFKT